MVEEQICISEQEALGAVTKRLTDELSARIQVLSLDIEKDGKELEAEGKSLEEDAKSWVTFETKWEDTRILIPVIEVVMKDQTQKFDLPQVKVEDERIVLKIPEVTMVPHKITQYPETTCGWEVKKVAFGVKTKVWTCKVTWKDVVTKMPEIVMRDKEIIIGIPKFWMDTTEITLKIPEFKASQKEIVIGLPQFTVKYIGGSTADEAKALEKKAEQLEGSAKIEVDEEIQWFKANIKTELAGPLNDYSSCVRADLVERRSFLVAQFEPAIAMMQKAINDIATAGGGDAPQTAELKQNLTTLIASQQEALATVDASIEDLNNLEKTVMDEILNAV
jgi:hypothetical protein